MAAMIPKVSLHADVIDNRKCANEVFRYFRTTPMSRREIELVKRAMFIGHREGYAHGYTDGWNEAAQQSRR